MQSPREPKLGPRGRRSESVTYMAQAPATVSSRAQNSSQLPLQASHEQLQRGERAVQIADRGRHVVDHVLAVVGVVSAFLAMVDGVLAWLVREIFN